MRVAFLGNAPWSVPSLEALADSSHDVGLVATRVPRRAGRGGKLRPTAVAEAARRLSLPLAEVETVKSGPGFERLAGAEPDALAVVAYGEIVPGEVLELPRVMPVNVHFSLLPELRGAAPVQRAIKEGLTATGVTTMRMDQGMDTGPILLQQEEAIDDADDAGSLGARLAAIGARLLVDTLDRLEAGTLRERPQDGALATYAPKLKPDDEVIDWSTPADVVARLVRALSPEPGGRTSFRGRVLKVFRATGEALVATGNFPPGTVLATDRDRMVVATGSGLVAIEELQPEGRRRMTVAEFVRGYRPETGEVLGAR